MAHFSTTIFRTRYKQKNLMKALLSFVHTRTIGSLHLSWVELYVRTNEGPSPCM